MVATASQLAGTTMRRMRLASVVIAALPPLELQAATVASTETGTKTYETIINEFFRRRRRRLLACATNLHGSVYRPANLAA